MLNCNWVWFISIFKYMYQHSLFLQYLYCSLCINEFCWTEVYLCWPVRIEFVQSLCVHTTWHYGEDREEHCTWQKVIFFVILKLNASKSGALFVEIVSQSTSHSYSRKPNNLNSKFTIWMSSFLHLPELLYANLDLLDKKKKKNSCQ